MAWLSITLELEARRELRLARRVALSGILETQSAEVVAAYAPDIAIAATATEEG